MNLLASKRTDGPYSIEYKHVIKEVSTFIYASIIILWY